MYSISLNLLYGYSWPVQLDNGPVDKTDEWLPNEMAVVEPPIWASYSIPLDVQRLIVTLIKL